MENTGKVLFAGEDAQTPQWFVALGKNWIGPLSAADVYEKVVNREITWAHFVWRKGQKEWQRLCEVPTFQSSVPAAPSETLKEAVSERSQELLANRRAKANFLPVPPEPDENTQKIWFLYFNETQYGPFSKGEIESYLSAGKIHSRVYAWKDGMKGWERIEKLIAFQKTATATPAPPPPVEKSDLRKTPRKPMVAKILMANDEDVIVAVCRDISIGGMQVLTDRVPGAVGTKVKLNVSPAGEGKEGAKTFKPFVAQGLIVRLLDDGRGFSFRFDKLTPAARASIEGYLEAAQ
jgi:hypothetical protein